VISASVMPSAKYSSSGLPDRFSSGSTANESIVFTCIRSKSTFRHRLTNIKPRANTANVAMAPIPILWLRNCRPEPVDSGSEIGAMNR